MAGHFFFSGSPFRLFGCMMIAGGAGAAVCARSGARLSPRARWADCGRGGVRFVGGRRVQFLGDSPILNSSLWRDGVHADRRNRRSVRPARRLVSAPTSRECASNSSGLRHRKCLKAFGRLSCTPCKRVGARTGEVRSELVIFVFGKKLSVGGEPTPERGWGALLIRADLPPTDTQRFAPERGRDLVQS